MLQEEQTVLKQSSVAAKVAVLSKRLKVQHEYCEAKQLTDTESFI